MKSFAGLAWACAALLSGCAAHGHVRGETGREIAAPCDYSLLPPERAEIARRFHDIVLVDQDGRRVRLFDDLVKGRIVVINFMYASCTGT